MKKTLSFVLAIIMCLCIPMTAFAADPTTTITLNITDSPFTYTLEVPATINFNEEAKDWFDDMVVQIPVKITGMTNLVAYSYEYKMQHIGVDYEVKITANATKMTSGTNTIPGSGICGELEVDYYGSKGTITLSSFDSEGTASNNNLHYNVSKYSLRDAAPGNYTATITFTATIEFIDPMD